MEEGIPVIGEIEVVFVDDERVDFESVVLLGQVVEDRLE